MAFGFGGSNALMGAFQNKVYRAPTPGTVIDGIVHNPDGSFTADGGTDLRGKRLAPTEVKPGQESQIRGLNEAATARNRFRQMGNSIEGTANQAGLSGALQRTRADSDTSFETAAGSLARRQRALGLNVTDRQKKTQKRRQSLTREIAGAEATNATRRDFGARAIDASIASGDLEDQIAGIESAGFDALDRAAAEQQVRTQQRADEKKKAEASLFGNAAGLGLSLLMLSDENAKHKKRPINESLLDRLDRVRVERWKYIGDDTDHVGAYAQEFNDTFGVGKGRENMISLVDAVGVTMGAIKELNAKVDARG
jgi:hypothetical protein